MRVRSFAVVVQNKKTIWLACILASLIALAALQLRSVRPVEAESGDDLTSGLVLSWNFEDEPGANVNDSSSSNNDAVLYDMDLVEAWSPDQPNTVNGNTQSLLMGSQDGNDYVASTDMVPAGVTGANPRSFCGWVKLSNDTDTQIAFNYGAQTLGQKFGIYASNGKWQFWGFSDSDFETTAETDLNWHHHCITYDGATVRYYFDGSLVGSNEEVLNTAQTAVLLGQRDGEDLLQPFYGNLDDIRLYNRTLEPWEINKIANRPAPGGVYGGLQLWLKADEGIMSIEGEIGSWVDQSGAENHATGHGIDLPTLLWGSDALANNFNPAIDFSGGDDEAVESSFSLPAGMADFRSGLGTFFVARQTESNTWARFLDFGNGDASDNVLFAQLGNDSRTSFQVYDGVLENGIDATDDDMTLNETRLYAAAQTGGIEGAEAAANIYNNGEALSFSRGPTVVPNNLTRNLNYIGRSNWDADKTFGGQMSEILLYNHTLSNDELSRINSYLALKYGLSLSQTVAQSYVASDGSTLMWDASLENGYNHTIFGIGRDDASGLDQRVSTSETARVLSVALDNDFISANQDDDRETTHQNDLQFLTFAHNGDSLVSQVDEVDTNVYLNRIGREWQVQKTNFTQSVSLKFEEYGSNFCLLVDSDGDFGSGAARAGCLDDNGVISGVNFTDGQFFTLAEMIPGEIESSVSSLVVPEGDNATFDVVLTSQPNSDVVVNVTSADEDVFTVSPATLTFTAENWDTPQTVTVTGANDGEVEDIEGEITVSVDTEASDEAWAEASDDVIDLTLDNSDTDTDDDGLVDEEDDDADGDGRDNSIEDEGNNDGDGNGDGLPDSWQDNVSAAYNPATESYATIETAGDCTTVTNTSFTEEVDLDVQDDEADYPVGLADFTVECDTPGGSTDVVIYYAQMYDTSEWVYKKYTASGQAYSDITSDVTFSTATIGSTVVTTASFTITDGDPSTDEDGLADGTIHDPSGPAVLALSTPASPSVPAAPSVAAPATGLAAQDSIMPYWALLAAFGLLLQRAKPSRTRQ